MARVDAFNKGRMAQDDEFYTRYEDIQTELNHYETHFKGKTVLCNCDDPFESNFCKFFLRNFNYLGLQRLICTSYYSSPVIGKQMILRDHLGQPVKQGHGYVMDISHVPMKNGRGVSDDDIEKLLKSKKNGVKKLKGNGDFRSEECIEYLKQADIVVTNPPFSLFREHLQIVIKNKKKFLLVSNPNALHYKEVFPLVMGNKIWVGYKSMSADMLFDVAPDFAEWLVANKKQGSGYRIVDGVVKGRAHAIWLTNLDIQKRHEDLVLYKQYTPDEYPKYVNYDAIEVCKVADIPKDYDGLMGVPDSFLDKYNPDQFEIIGCCIDLAEPMKTIAPPGTFQQGGPTFYTTRLNENDRKKGFKYHRGYDRIVIRNKRPQSQKGE